MARQRHAFTLIELMAAMAIGVLLLSVVVQTFRAITRTISVVNLQRRENELLRAGFIAVLEDADFYHSEANPDPPYNKGWTRAPLTAADPADKRHFARVAFSAKTAPQDPYAARTYPAALRLEVPAAAESASNQRVLPNPNVLLPSDPRSWVRTETMTNTDWGYLRPQKQRAGHFVIGSLDTDQVWGMGQLAAATDMRDLQTFPASALRRMPEDGVTVGEGLAVDPLRNQTLPCLQAALWHYLSYVGMWAYLRPGAPMICHDTQGFLPAWYTIQTGQIISSPLPPFYPAPVAPYTARPAGVPVAQKETDYLNGPGATGSNTQISRWGMRATLDTTTGLQGTLMQVGIQVKPVYPSDTAFSGLALTTHGQSSSDSTYKWAMNNRPWFWNFYNWKDWILQNDDQSRTPAYTSTTYRFPSNLTDVERPAVANTGTVTINPAPIDLAGRPPEYPVMSTSIMRQHCYMGDQIVYCRVLVRMPETGRLIELPVSPVCTTYRGARQHWARVTSATLATPAGDSYVP